MTGSDLLFAMGRNTEDCKYAKFWYLDKAHKAVTLNLCFLSVGTLLMWQIETICLSQKVNCMISYANHHWVASPCWSLGIRLTRPKLYPRRNWWMQCKLVQLLSGIIFTKLNSFHFKLVCVYLGLFWKTLLWKYIMSQIWSTQRNTLHFWFHSLEGPFTVL